MSDYNVTRSAAAKVTDKFSNMLRDLEDDFEEEIVVRSLMKYYKLCSNEHLMGAIECILLEYMSLSDFNEWMLTAKDKSQ